MRAGTDALGPDAVILSNRPVDGVVEILALDNDHVASLAVPGSGSDMAQPAPRLDLNSFDEALPSSTAAPAPTPERVQWTHTFERS